MEFGVFLNGYIPGPGAHDTKWEHQQLLREAEYAVFADKHNWKYAWFGETDYIHLGTAINSLSPRKEHPVRYAERAAMLDHFTNNRFEWGTGRGAGSHEMASFNILDKDSTKPEWEEVVHEIPRMWEQVDYSFQGDHFTVPTPHNILPKPYGKGHPPIWVACGNPPTFARAGELGIGAIAFNFEPIYNLRGRIESYKEAIAECREPLGQYMNDNVMMTNAVICLEDRDRARKLALERVSGYLVTMVNLYHDTMPKSPDAIVWPNPPIRLLDLAAGDPEALLDEMIAGSGTPTRSRSSSPPTRRSVATSSCSGSQETCTATSSSSSSSSSATRSSPSTTPIAPTRPTGTGPRLSRSTSGSTSRCPMSSGPPCCP
jgi:alkanesulfonate monooxygenase SsuD/methylene tetrahydromethanopterin reductase-like flavin-dependent oxidoreductase (luciferase family)